MLASTMWKWWSCYKDLTTCGHLVMEFMVEIVTVVVMYVVAQPLRNAWLIRPSFQDLGICGAPTCALICQSPIGITQIV